METKGFFNIRRSESTVALKLKGNFGTDNIYWINHVLINRKFFHLLLITLAFVFLNPYIFEDRARGENHFIESLTLIRFDEKVKAQNFALKDLNGNEVHLEDYRGKIIFLNFWNVSTMSGKF